MTNDSGFDFSPDVDQSGGSVPDGAGDGGLEETLKGSEFYFERAERFAAFVPSVESAQTYALLALAAVVREEVGVFMEALKELREQKGTGEVARAIRDGFQKVEDQMWKARR